jgi:hypothetical protein
MCPIGLLFYIPRHINHTGLISIKRNLQAAVPIFSSFDLFKVVRLYWLENNEMKVSMEVNND